MQNKNRSKLLHMTQLAMLSAIIIIMSFTPLGYLKVGFLSITFLTIPVVIGAIMLGPIDGAILGAVFGATSFAQCFGLEPFGTTLLSIDPVLTFLLCLIPRILIGFTTGYALKSFKKIQINQIATYVLSSLTGVLTNTVFFLGFVFLFFGRTDYIQSFGDSFLKILIALAGTNAITEAVVCTIIAAILTKALVSFTENVSIKNITN